MKIFDGSRAVALLLLAAAAASACGALELHYVKFNATENGQPIEVKKWFFDSDVTDDGPMSTAFKAVQNNDMPGAMKILNDDIAKNPANSYWQHYDIGILYEATGQWDKAEAEMKTAQMLEAAAGKPAEKAYSDELVYIAAHKPPPAPVATVAPTPPPTVTAPPEPTPEEKKKAEDKKALDAERAAWDATHKKELERWTPEMHTAAKALADKAYPTGHAAIAAMISGKHRAPANAERDKYRHPLETLDFFGFQPTMTVIDIGPGEGFYTELLAPALAKKGHYLATGGDPNGPSDMRSTFYAQRFKGFVDTAPELYGKVEAIVIDSKAPHLAQEGTVEMVLIMRGVHGMVNAGTFDTWLKEIAKALKPNGVLGIEEHRAKPDADVKESAKKGYVPEKFIIDAAAAAGLKLAKQSDINANPKDLKDHPDGVWNLPPTYRAGDKDKDKYAAIGESDRMTLKFVKAPIAVPTAAPKAAPPPPPPPPPLKN